MGNCFNQFFSPPCLISCTFMVWSRFIGFCCTNSQERTLRDAEESLTGSLHRISWLLIPKTFVYCLVSLLEKSCPALLVAHLFSLFLSVRSVCLTVVMVQTLGTKFGSY